MLIETTEQGTVYRLYIATGDIRAVVSKCGTDLLRHAERITPADEQEIRNIMLERREYLEARYFAKLEEKFSTLK